MKSEIRNPKSEWLLNRAKRLECVQLAAAAECSRAVDCSTSLEDPAAFESGSKLRALQTLRAVRLPIASSAFIASVRFGWFYS